MKIIKWRRSTLIRFSLSLVFVLGLFGYTLSAQAFNAVSARAHLNLILHSIRPTPLHSGELAVAALVALWTIFRISSSVRRHRVEQQLLEAFLEHIPDNVFFKDRDSRFVRISQSMANYFGMADPAQAVNKTDSDIFSSEHAGQAFEDEQEIMRTGQSLVAIEEKETWPDGHETWVLTTKVPLRDRKGRTVGTMGISHDITNRKLIVRELEEYKTRLEELVAIRTAELAELAVARDAADSANRAKSMFLANMSHELRTPLNAILGYAQLLKRDPSLSKWQLEASNTIQQSGEHLLLLITDILDLSKIEAGKLELQLSSVKLPSFLQGIADIIRIKAEEKALEFAFHLPSDLPTFVQADQKRLRQVLLNLLSNAVKFSDQGRVDFCIRVLSHSNAEVQLAFEVCDTGTGIAPDQMEKIFRPFEQVCDGQQRSGGTGLGLSISRQLVRLMGSDIQVESKPGEGSRFWFEVSAKIVEAEQTVFATTGRKIGYEGSRKRVLVVDDSLGNRALLTDILSRLGFELGEAVNGEEGLERAQQIAPDLILMDIRMPIMGGLEATRLMREIPQLRTVPIIAISANVHQEDQAASLAAGANTFLAKPIEDELLLQEVGKALDLKWICEEIKQSPASASDCMDQFVVPGAEEMESLRALAKAGNMRAIKEQSLRLAALDQQYRPFAEKIRQLAQGYQSKALLHLVEKHVAQKQVTGA